LEMAERHVTEADRHVEHQRQLIEALVRDGHSMSMLERARKVLEILEQSLKLAHKHYALEGEFLVSARGLSQHQTVSIQRSKASLDDLEAELAMVRRHVQEAEARLLRLEALAAKGHYRSVDLIFRLIGTMQQSVELARSHAARVARKATKPTPI